MGIPCRRHFHDEGAGGERPGPHRPHRGTIVQQITSNTMYPDLAPVKSSKPSKVKSPLKSHMIEFLESGLVYLTGVEP